MNPRLLCPACERGQHTEPGEESLQAVCACGERTCACYGVRVKSGAARDRSAR